MLVVNVNMLIGELGHFQKDPSLRGMHAIGMVKGKMQPVEFMPVNKKDGGWSYPTTIVPYVILESVAEFKKTASHEVVARATYLALQDLKKKEYDVVLGFLKANTAILFAYTLHDSIVMMGESKDKKMTRVIAYADKRFIGMVQVGGRRLHSRRWGSDAKPGLPVSFTQ